MERQRKGKIISDMSYLIIEMLEVFHRQDIYLDFKDELKKKTFTITIEEKEELDRLKKLAKAQYQKCLLRLKGFNETLRKCFVMGDK